MATAKMTVGMIGENAAAEYLLGEGHLILERNWRSGHGELDIITLAADGLHIVEVKTRVAPITADPLENVDWKKRNKMVQTAGRYLASAQKRGNIPANVEVFFDVVSVVLDGGKFLVDYIPRAFIPMYTH